MSYQTEVELRRWQVQLLTSALQILDLLAALDVFRMNCHATLLTSVYVKAGLPASICSSHTNNWFETSLYPLSTKSFDVIKLNGEVNMVFAK